MKNPQRQSNPVPGDARCPYLGLRDDPQTCLAFPSDWNCCHRAQPPDSVRPNHQRRYCQTSDYQTCPVFQNQKSLPLPAELRGRGPAGLHHSRRRSGPLPVRIAALVLVMIVVGLAWMGLLPDVFSASPFNAPQSTIPASRTAPPPSPSSVAIPLVPPLVPSASEYVPPTSIVPFLLQTPTLTSTVPPTPTPSPLGQCGRQLETSFGSNPGLLIHRVRSGDSLNMYADTYHTSVEAIQALNYRLPIPMWKDWVVVIPPGQTQVLDLPSFELYQVTEPGTTLTELSSRLSVDSESLMRYNDFDASCRTVMGWLLVPHSDTTP